MKSLNLVSSKVGTIIFADIDDKFKIFAVNRYKERLGVTLMMVERAIHRIKSLFKSITQNKQSLDVSEHSNILA